jgi:putative cell wall-binding protein
MGGVFGASDGVLLVPGETAPAGEWVRSKLWLPEGEQPIMFLAYNSAKAPSDVRLYVDDLVLTAHQFTDLGAVGAGATSLDFTVPSTVTDDAWFRVAAHLNGVDSAVSTVKGVRLVSDSAAPAAPASLRLAPDNDGSVGISWTNPTDADYAETLVLASTDHTPTGRDDAAAIVAYEGTGTAASFGPVADGVGVHVAAWAVDTSGNWSAVCTADTLAVDKTPPAAPRALRSISAVPGLPSLYWAGADVSGEASATVLRSYTSTPTVGDPDAMLVDSWAGFAVDERLDPDATQAFYTVYLTDPSGNVSAPTSLRVVIDPAGVSGAMNVDSPMQVGSAALVQSTTVSVLADVTNATEMRVWTNGERNTDADWVPFAAQFPVDLLPIQGPQTVNAEFRSDPMSEPIELSADVLLVLHDPLAPSGLVAESHNTGVKLAWDVPDDPSLTGYRVFDAASPVGPWMPLVGPEGVPMAGSWYFTGPLAPGFTHYFKVTAIDALGREGADSNVATASAGVGVVRFDASNRAANAAAASVGRFSPYPGDPYMSDSVVIAPDADYIQALAANSLAGSLNASVLLAGKTLPVETIREISRLKVRKAYVVGTTGAVAASVDRALKALGLKVERITGSDAYDVAAKVARRVMTPAAITPGPVQVIVVSGASKSDMCALMPVAYSSRVAVLVVKKDSVPPATKSLIAKVQVVGGTVIGGTGAVSDKVARAVFGGPGYARVWGQHAAQTSAKLAAWAVERGYATWDRVSVANGDSWTSNLAIGAATHGGVVLLSSVRSLDPAVVALLRANAAGIDKVAIFGGYASVNASVQAKIRAAMGAPSGPVANAMPTPPPFPTGM